MLSHGAQACYLVNRKNHYIDYCMKQVFLFHILLFTFIQSDFFDQLILLITPHSIQFINNFTYCKLLYHMFLCIAILIDLYYIIIITITFII